MVLTPIEPNPNPNSHPNPKLLIEIVQGLGLELGFTRFGNAKCGYKYNEIIWDPKLHFLRLGLWLEFRLM